MEYEIYALSEDKIDDFIYFFDELAFSDDDEWKGCYCVFYHVSDDSSEKIDRKKMAIELIKQKKLNGYLAYCDGKVIGWCNTSDKKSYPRIVNDKTLWDKNDDNKRIKSIVCFTIALSMRSKGVATKLLERICAGTKSENYDYIESYPRKDVKEFSRNYKGTVGMYKKLGFDLYKELDGGYIYRKPLR